MPICRITMSEDIDELNEFQINKIRDIVAEGLLSDARDLDRNHIVVRMERSRRAFMLGEIEIALFAQDDPQRYESRDNRAKNISERISKLLQHDCATWINLLNQGYCRVRTNGETYFSD